MTTDPTTRARRLTRRGALLAAGTAVAVTGIAGPASAGTSGTGTATVAFASGGLNVVAVAPTSAVAGTVGGSATGLLPAVTLQDATGSGAGWNATVAVSDLTYTGTWSAVGVAVPLLTATSGPFTDTVDGVTYTLTTGTVTNGAGSFTYTSNDPADPSGSGTAVAATANAVGTKGVTVNFGVQSLTAGSQYRIKVGTEPSSAIALDTSAVGAAVVTTLGNTAPSLTGNGTVVAGGGTGAAAYGSPVKFATAAVGTGMGTYVVTPGVTVAGDSVSWLGPYSAGVQYSIVSGP